MEEHLLRLKDWGTGIVETPELEVDLEECGRKNSHARHEGDQNSTADANIYQKNSQMVRLASAPSFLLGRNPC